MKLYCIKTIVFKSRINNLTCIYNDNLITFKTISNNFELFFTKRVILILVVLTVSIFEFPIHLTFLKLLKFCVEDFQTLFLCY